MFNATMLSIALKTNTYEDWRITREQSLTLIPSDVDEAMDLLGFANKIRQRFKLRRVNKCGSIAVARGTCLDGCGCCRPAPHSAVGGGANGMRCADELIQAGVAVAAGGGTHFAMAANGNLWSAGGVEAMCRAARGLRRSTNLVLCVATDRLDQASACRLKAAGIDRYHLQYHAGPRDGHPTDAGGDFGDRLAGLRAARAAGLDLCCSGVLGAGDTWAQRVDLAFALRQLDAAAITIRFWPRTGGAQIGQRPALSPMAALTCIALFRFVHPHRDIVVADGWERVLGEFRSWALFAGANGFWMAPDGKSRVKQMVMDSALIAEQGPIDGQTAAVTIDVPALPRRHLAP